MWTILRYRYISCFKNIFSPFFFFCKNKLSLLVSAVLIAVAMVLNANIAFIFMKVDSHFYGIGYTSIFRVFKAFSLLIFYMGFYIFIWGFSWGISGVFKKISVGALVLSEMKNMSRYGFNKQFKKQILSNYYLCSLFQVFEVCCYVFCAFLSFFVKLLFPFLLVCCTF